MKTLLWVLGGVVMILNGALAVFPNSRATLVVQAISTVAGLGVIIAAVALKIRRSPSVPPNASRPEPQPVLERASPPATLGTLQAPGLNAEAEIVAFLALLQEKGRLVDFVREEIAAASDEQVGAAARVVHAGCRQVLNEYFEIAPVRAEPEGSRISLPPGYDAASYRLLGSVAAQPPYTGKLVHPGWAVHAVKLPRVTGLGESRRWPMLAPAEVEVGGG